MQIYVEGQWGKEMEEGERAKEWGQKAQASRVELQFLWEREGGGGNSQ